VGIVNQALAERLFPGENAIGKRFRTAPDRGEWTEIIGIAQDGKYQSLNDVSEPAIFWPRSQRYNSTIAVIVRSSRPSDEVVRSVTRAVNSLDSTLPFFQSGSLEDHMRVPLMPARIAASMLGAFGFLAIILAATGVYGTLAYAISRRTREIGIRVAIGATRADVLRLVLRRAALILATATSIGAIVTLALGRFFSPILYGVSPRDPATYALALGLMAAVGLCACLAPARRALRIEPAMALRED